jgi:hypothetical protein
MNMGEGGAEFRAGYNAAVKRGGSREILLALARDDTNYEYAQGYASGMVDSAWEVRRAADTAWREFRRETAEGKG